METTTKARMLTNKELGTVIALMRRMQQWSQETLAELSGLTTLTIQRIEKGDGGSADSRRAIGKAFCSEDIDVFNKPFAISTPEEVERQKNAFERECVLIAPVSLATGKQLVQLAETTQAHSFTTMGDYPAEVGMVLAELEDMFAEFRDIHDHYSATGKVEIYAEFQELINALTAIDMELCYATRRVSVNSNDSNRNPLPCTILYLLVYRKGDMPENLAVDRKVSFGW